jgi:PAS domain S-box-containing protein
MGDRKSEIPYFNDWKQKILSVENLIKFIHSIDDAIIIIDAKGKIALINESAQELTEYRAEEAIGKSLDKIFCISDEKAHKRYENPLDLFLRDDKLYFPDRAILTSKNDKEYLITNTGIIIHDKSGNISGASILFRDITETQETGKNNLKSDEFNSTSTIIRDIAHDFNNILTVILGNISLAKMYVKTDEKVFDKISEAEEFAIQAKNLSQNLTTFLRSGFPVLRSSSVSEWLQRLEHLTLKDSEVRYNISIPDDLWEVKTDALKMSQVFSNLIVNIDQAGLKGDIIDLRAENVFILEGEDRTLNSGRYVKMSVKNRKIGISIHVYFPASTEKIEDQIGTGKKPDSSAGNILVMDDEAIIRELTHEMLVKLGYRVITAKNGNEAVELYRKAKGSGRPFDAVIMDLIVPGDIGGEQAIRILKEMDPDAKIIISSGNFNNPLMSNSRKYGFCPVIAKPYRMSELHQVLQETLGESEDHITT